jgi:hypothetical protein
MAEEALRAAEGLGQRPEVEAVGEGARFLGLILLLTLGSEW